MVFANTGMRRRVLTLSFAFALIGSSVCAVAHDGGSDGSGDSGHSGRDDGVVVSGNTMDDHGGASGNSGTGGGGHDDGVENGNQNDDHGGAGGNRGNGVVSHGNAQEVEVKGQISGLFQGFQAKLRVVVDNSNEKFKVEVEDVNLPPGTPLNVCLNGNSVGNMLLDASHEAELELEAEDGAPTLSFNTGDVVEVRQDLCTSTQQPLLALKIGGASHPAVAVTPIRLGGKDETLFAGFEAELNVSVEVRSDRGRFGAEVEDVNLVPGTSLSVCRMGQSLGSIVLDLFHTGDLDLDSRRGDSIPTLSAGDVIAVREDACSSVTAPLLAATLEPR